MREVSTAAVVSNCSSFAFMFFTWIETFLPFCPEEILDANIFFI